MRTIRVPKENDGFIRITETNDFEFLNPVEHFKDVVMNSSIRLDEDQILMNDPSFPLPIMRNILIKRAEKDWEEYYRHFKSITLPENLLNLLDTKSKSEQIKILKGMSLTSDQYATFLLVAGEQYGYTLSSYHSHHLPQSFDNTQLPTLFHKKADGTFSKIGESTLNDRQLNQVLEQRKVIIARFLDRKDQWHCFYHTFRSLNGKENHKDGQPHLHYISNFWTTPRETVVKELKNKTQNFTSSIHIDFNYKQ